MQIRPTILAAATAAAAMWMPFSSFANPNDPASYASDQVDSDYEAAMQAFNCGATSYTAFVGGFVASRSCNGTYLEAVGSTRDDSTLSLDEFSLLHAERGLACRTNSLNRSTAVPGGFIFRFHCGDQSMSVTGSNATGVGQNALLFAKVIADYGTSCTITNDFGQIQPFAGGYVLNYQCGGSSVGGIGDMTTGGATAASFARKLGATGVACSLATSGVSQTVIQINGATLANFFCNGGVGTISGLGSNSIEAGQNAAALGEAHTANSAACVTSFANVVAAGGPGFITGYNCGGTRISGAGGRYINESASNGVGFAQLFARSGIACTTSPAQFLSSGPFSKTVTFSCTGGTSVTGTGRTSDVAAADALAQANARWP